MSQQLRRIARAICYLFMLVLSDSYAIEADTLRLVALDVGEGQAILLQRGTHGILIDTGHAGKAKYVLDRLDYYGVTKLDYLILTHLHPDHASGYFRLREAFPTTPILSHQLPHKYTKHTDMARWVAEAIENDPHSRQYRSDNHLQWHGITITPLWPKTKRNEDLNDNSLVLEVDYRQHKALLMGDVGSTIEEELMKGGLLSAPYAILVAGHHGSKGTSSNTFLTQVKPEVAIISTNRDNHRGYPAPKTMKRLQRHTTKAVYKTYEDGDICLEWQPNSKSPHLCRLSPEQ